MNKAFADFDWENFPSVNTPINATNLNKLNDAIDTIDDRVVAMDTDKANTDAISDEIETLDSAALYAHDADSFFLASNGKVYKATVSIAVGDTITVGTNCALDNIIDNLGGGSTPTSSGHTIVDSNGTEYTQRAKLKFNNATITDDSSDDATVVTPSGGSGGATRLSDLNDVNLTSLEDGQILVWNDTTNKWENKLPSSDNVIIMSQTLTAGNTSVTFTNLPSTGDYFADFYNSAGIPMVSINTSVSGQVTVTFTAQSSDITVYCKLEEVSLV